MNPRVLVVSHACVLDANQSVYADLQRECEVTLVVPQHWRDELRPGRYDARRLARFGGDFLPVPTLGLGRPQRHIALVRAAHLLRQHKSDFLVIEEEPFSVAAIMWSLAARRLSIPYAVQVAENLERRLPGPFRRACARVLRGSSFVLARSPAALARAREWGYVGPSSVLAHGVDTVSIDLITRPRNVLGFVGRLTAAKGVSDLLRVMNDQPQLSLRVAGDGPLRESLATLGDRVTMLGTIAPSTMSSYYESVSVLVVPSRTTPTWSEQFGRVLVEAQACATPVVAYNSGEIPWVAGLTSVRTVPEGDVGELGREVAHLASDVALAREIGERGRAGVAANFTNAIVAEQMALFIARSLRGS